MTIIGFHFIWSYVPWNIFKWQGNRRALDNAKCSTTAVSSWSQEGDARKLKSNVNLSNWAIERVGWSRFDSTLILHTYPFSLCHCYGCVYPILSRKRIRFACQIHLSFTPPFPQSTPLSVRHENMLLSITHRLIMTGMIMTISFSLLKSLSYITMKINKRNSTTTITTDRKENAGVEKRIILLVMFVKNLKIHIY